jgi:hypothetical protein
MVLHQSAAPEDAQTSARQNLIALRSQLQIALGRPGVKITAETRAHLTESVSRIDDALKANMQRAGF